MELNKLLEKKLSEIIEFFKERKIIIGFSGGVDSSLLAYLSKKYAKKTLLITEYSILYPKEEIDSAIQFAKKFNIEHILIERDPLNNEEFKKNPRNRCYLCKKGLYSEIERIKNDRSYDFIIDGTNSDDLSDYRPGVLALKELQIETPYIKFEINKDEIRKLCSFFDLDVKSKPSMACFSSRIPYYQEITKNKLTKIMNAESFLKKEFNLKQLRVRYHENDLARIEFLKEDLPDILTQENLLLINNAFKALGFKYITIDIEGFRSGSMNEVLSTDEIKNELNVNTR
ncbi:MAG: ATP-dependent sacrificial sulfur transferase LarE [Candidatus Lokiarchaeota archaeon]|nr:ATP-dependent sacrificial sulfur transferase LarE [Candidatus Lokiarchaeota archaeon]